MCGIAGIAGLEPRRPVDPERLARMRDALRHRGPDGEGSFFDGSVALGHRRLAIVDLEGGAQPMAGCDENLWLVCNGEIYNHPDLRRRLERRGHRFRTRSDSESILHLYEDEGERCVDSLRGMFAFALWDRRRRRLLLARDRLGIKPLYYALTDSELLFASEIKAILAAGSIRPALDESILPQFLANRYVAGESTFFRGIRKLLPGRTLVWSPGQEIVRRRYWRPPVPGHEAAPGAPASLREAASEIRAGLEEAVSSHLMSDVPVGLFLSGGIDSTALAALAAPRLSGPLQTFSVGFAERSANELGYARLAARSVGAQHREILVSPGDFFAALPRLVWHEDEPLAFPSSVPLHFVSRLAQPHVKVVLTGEGADELFLGYNRYRVSGWNDRLARACAAVLPRAARAALARGIRGAPAPLRRYLERTFLALEPGPRSMIFENFAVFPEAMQRRLLADPDLLGAAADAPRSGGACAGDALYAEGMRLFAESGSGILERMGHVDLQTYLVELLMKQDQMSMSASIESRVPFLDDRLVERVAALPARYKIRGTRTKAVLREAVRDLVPRAILERRKMGFPVPIGEWLRGPHASLLDDMLLGERAAARRLFDPAALRALVDEHRRGAGRHGDRLWILLNLEIWQRIFLDGESPGAFPAALQNCHLPARGSPPVHCGDHPNAPSPASSHDPRRGAGMPIPEDV